MTIMPGQQPLMRPLIPHRTSFISDEQARATVDALVGDLPTVMNTTRMGIMRTKDTDIVAVRALAIDQHMGDMEDPTLLADTEIITPRD